MVTGLKWMAEFLEAKRDTWSTEECLPQVFGEMLAILYRGHHDRILGHDGSYEVFARSVQLIRLILTMQDLLLACPGMQHSDHSGPVFPGVC
jgi:hypothetical protein